MVDANRSAQAIAEAGFSARRTYIPGLSDGLLSLQERGTLCDVELLASDGVVVKAHRAVLAASSSYFRAQFTGPWGETAKHASVELPHVRGATLEICVKLLYTSSEAEALRWLAPVIDGFIQDSDFGGIEEVLRVLNFLDAPHCQTNVERALSSGLTDAQRAKVFEHLFILWRIAADTNSNTLRGELEWMAAGRLPELLESPQGQQIGVLPFLTLLDKLLDVPHHCDSLARLHAQGYSHIFWLAIGLWVLGNVDEHMAEVKRWIKAEWQSTDLIFLKPGIMIDALELLLADNQDPALKARVLKPLLEMVRESRNVFAPKWLRAPASLMVCGGRSAQWMPVRVSERLEADRHNWSAAPSCETTSAFVCGVDIPEGMFVLPHTAAGSRAYIYNAATDSWSPAFNGCTLSDHLHAAVARLADSLYLMGGKQPTQSIVGALDDVSVFSLSAECWERGPKLREPRCCHSAAALQGHVYVAGGQPARHLLRSVDRLDPERGWSAGPSLLDERKYLALTAHAGRLIAVGGMTSERKRLATVEALDPRDCQGWVRLPSMSVARSSAGVAAMGDKIWAVGGTDISDQPLATVEAFDFAAGRWMAMPPLQTARTGHAVAAIQVA